MLCYGIADDDYPPTMNFSNHIYQVLECFAGNPNRERIPRFQKMFYMRALPYWGVPWSGVLQYIKHQYFSDLVMDEYSYLVYIS